MNQPTSGETVLCCTVRGGFASLPTFAAKVGPLGINPRKLVDEISEQTKEFYNLRVPVKLTVKGRNYTIEVQPSVPNLIIKALNEPRRIKGRHYGDVSLNDLIQIARIVRPRSLSATFEGTLKEVIGSANAVGGITVNGGMLALDLLKAISSGEIEIPKE